MAYDDWTPEFQDLWENLPADYGDLTQEQLDYAEFMFEEGFMNYQGEQSPIDTDFARQEFFDMFGPEVEGSFDWQGWREAMGYELSA